MKINDLTTYPVPPPPAIPPAGNTFIDPTFGTTILRVTDENFVGGAGTTGANFTNQYSAIYDMFNADSSRFSIFEGGGQLILDLDVKARKASNMRPVNTPGGVYYWSRIDPDILYAVETWAAAKIWKYNCASATWTLIVDLSTLLPALTELGSNASWCGSRGLSWDDTRIHITALNGAYAYDIRQAKLIGPYSLAMAQASGWKPDPASEAYLFNKSTMDSSGKVAFTADTNLVFNIETGASFLPGFNTPEKPYNDVHADFGDGNVMIGTGTAPPTVVDGFYPFQAKLDPDNLASYLTPRRILGPRFLWGIGVHTAFRDAAGKWSTFSIDDTPPIGADAGKVAIFGPEVLQFGVDSPPDGSVNQRIAHHHTNPSVFSDSATQYWATCKASGSQDNRMIGWNSTYANKRIDVFIAFLDEPAESSGTTITLTPDEVSAIKSIAAKL